MPNQVDGVLMHTMSGTELSTYEPHSNDGEYSQPFRHIQYRRTASTPSHRHLGNALVPTHRQVQVPTSPVRLDTRCCLGCLHQQEAQQGTALLADVSQSLFSSTGVLTRNHPHVGADLFYRVETESESR